MTATRRTAMKTHKKIPCVCEAKFVKKGRQENLIFQTGKRMKIANVYIFCKIYNVNFDFIWVQNIYFKIYFPCKD